MLCVSVKRIGLNIDQYIISNIETGIGLKNPVGQALVIIKARCIC